MPRLILMRLARLATGAFLTLLACVLSAPGSAVAGCAHDRPTASHFEGLTRAGAMAGLDSVEAPAGKLPTCSGPLCSRGPAAPPSSPWGVAPARDSWACLVERLTPAPSLEHPLPAEAVAALPSPVGQSVFHPPRVSPI
jgi:hypothetical protein